MFLKVLARRERYTPPRPFAWTPPSPFLFRPMGRRATMRFPLDGILRRERDGAHGGRNFLYENVVREIPPVATDCTPCSAVGLIGLELGARHLHAVNHTIEFIHNLNVLELETLGESIHPGP